MNQQSGSLFEVEFLSGPNDGMILPFDVEEVIVGREPDHRLRITNDSTVSRRHARIRCVDDQISIEDLGSSFGTSLNGIALREECSLSPSDIVSVGHTEFVCRLAGRSETSSNDVSCFAEAKPGSEMPLD